MARDRRQHQQGGHGEKATRPLLSASELALLARFEDMIEENGYPPTYRELAACLGWRSSGSVAEYVERLRQKGVLEGRGRSLRVVG